ncbi:hypothetical protein ACLMJK_001393 [Lecanora helva]
MAEIVGLLASVVTLGQAIGTRQHVLAKLKSCYNAPPEVARIRIEIERLATLLASVEDSAKASPSGTMNTGLSDCVTLATGRIASINQILTSPVFGIKRLSDANKARATILRYKNRLASLEHQLKASIQEISLHLTIAIA